MRCIISCMGYVFLLIASFAGITKMAAMKGCGKVCPGAYNSVRINAFRSLLCAAAAVMIYVYSFFATLAAEALPSAVYYPLARGVSMLLTVLCDSIVFRQKITGNVWAALAFIFAAIALTSL